MVRRLLVAGWIWLCLSGCRPLVPDEAGPLSADELEAVELAYDVWESSGRSIPEGCAHVWEFRTNRDGGEVFERWCGAPAALEGGVCPVEGERCGLGCYKLGRRPRSTARRPERALPVIMQAPWLSPAEVRMVMVHETFHYLLECSGNYLGDPLHGDRAVWDSMMEEALNGD